ncbi:unnamed protein product [Dovyalis caffra]|uniref:FRIGIDA-like protein n=1 Tax=Dovyalis caffra TaxID=77055 RepID=A0AAV1RXT3_9ROSI|nr:unnamed protein product [Dovyalis caffra]
MVKVVEQREEDVKIQAKKCEECTAELENKERQLGLVKDWILVCELGLSSRENELHLVWQEIKDCKVMLSVKKEKLRSVQTDIELKERNLGSLERLSEELCKEIFEKVEKLGSVRKLVEEQSKELEFNGREVEKVKKLIANCGCDLELKQKELRKVWNLIDDCNGELSSKEMALKMLQERSSAEFVYVNELDCKEKELNLIQKSIVESSKEFDTKKQHLGSISLLIDEYTAELETKEEQNDGLKKSINKCSAVLKSKETELKKLESKEEELNKIKGRINAYNKELESRERVFNAIQMSIEDRSEELTGKEQQLKSVQLSLGECETELEEMKEQKNSIQKSIVECSEELQPKEKNLVLTRESLRECCDELELKKVQLYSIQRSSHELKKKFEEREKHLNSLENTLDERLKNLGVKERQFEERVKEIELKEQLLRSMQKSVEQRHKEVEILLNAFSKLTIVLLRHGLFTFSGSKAWFNAPFLLDVLRNPRSECREIGCLGKGLGSNILSLHARIDQTDVRNPKHASSSTFQFNATASERSSQPVNECVNTHHLMHLGVSVEPAKYVLDFMLWSFSQNWKNGVAGLDASVKRNHVLLLEHLMKVSPKISPQVKEDAIKLAVIWEKNIRLETEDSMEVLMFLFFLAIYGLVYCFSRDRILRLIGTIAHKKEAPEIFKALGFADKDLVPVFIENLFGNKQYIAAARFSYAFGVVGRFSPELILKKYMEDACSCKGIDNSNEAQACGKAIDEALSALRSMAELVADCKYESRYMIEDIIRSVSALEKRKAAWTLSLQ